jgi:hypothetical protein
MLLHGLQALRIGASTCRASNILTDKIEIEPVGSGRQRGLKFRGALTVDRLIGGDANVGSNNTLPTP